jgi:N-acetylglutamate synthase-like GNAT family acetyltransferase
MADALIRPATEADSGLLVDIIQRSFRTVAERFGLTMENCPVHPSNYTLERVQRDFTKGIAYFIAEKDGQAVGCVALEKADRNTFYLERLAVLPDSRCQGVGYALVQHVFQLALGEGANLVSIAIIAQHTDLERWYRGLGFEFVETKQFPHLTFEVTFMKWEVRKA